MTIYVGNLSFQATRNELSGVFTPYGTVERVHIATDQETGRLRGFAFVDMGADHEEAASIAALNGTELMGRDLRVNIATPRPEKQPLASSGQSSQSSQSLETGSMPARPLLAKRRSEDDEITQITDRISDPDMHSYGHV